MFAYKLNLLHAFLLPLALACLYFAVWENRRRTIRPRRLFWAPWLALFMALLLVFFEAKMKEPTLPFWGALAVCLAIGAARGLTMKLQVDEFWLVVRPSGRRAVIWIGAAVLASALIEMGGALIGQEGRIWRYYAALAAMGCAGLLFGRAFAVALRVWRLIG